jgi:hypothetical protein
VNAVGACALAPPSPTPEQAKAKAAIKVFLIMLSSPEVPVVSNNVSRRRTTCQLPAHRSLSPRRGSDAFHNDVLKKATSRRHFKTSLSASHPTLVGALAKTDWRVNTGAA